MFRKLSANNSMNTGGGKTGAATNAAVLLFCFLLSAFTGCGGRGEGSPGTDSPPPAAAADPEKQSRERGRQIIDEFLKRSAAPFRKSRVRITVVSETDPAGKTYELDSWRRQTADETVTLTQFVKPAEDRDLGSLAVETKGEETVVVTYASALDEFRETDTGKMFFGGLTAQELLGEWGKYEYRLLGEKPPPSAGEGARFFEVEGRLAPGRESAIARFTALFRADIYLPVEIHSFNSGGKEIRTFRVRDFRTEAGRAFASRTEVENHVYKTRIVIEILETSFPDKIDDSVFTRQQLKQIARKGG